MRFKHYLLINILAMALICWIAVNESTRSQRVILGEVEVLIDTVRNQQQTIVNYQRANATLQEHINIRDSLIVEQKVMLKNQKEMIKNYESNLDSLHDLFRDIRKSNLPERYRSDNP